MTSMYVRTVILKNFKINANIFFLQRNLAFINDMRAITININIFGILPKNKKPLTYSLMLKSLLNLMVVFNENVNRCAIYMHA